MSQTVIPVLRSNGITSFTNHGGRHLCRTYAQSETFVERTSRKAKVMRPQMTIRLLKHLIKAWFMCLLCGNITHTKPNVVYFATKPLLSSAARLCGHFESQQRSEEVHSSSKTSTRCICTHIRSPRLLLSQSIADGLQESTFQQYPALPLDVPITTARRCTSHAPILHRLEIRVCTSFH
ncbi:hypothetical protein AAHC03_04956 [Spirometra sp. Aus1]